MQQRAITMHIDAGLRILHREPQQLPTSAFDPLRTAITRLGWNRFNRKGSKTMRCWLLPTCVAAFASPAQAASHPWQTASSIGRDALVVVALGVPLVQGDWKGEKQAALSIAGTSLVTKGVKKIIPEERPDSSDNRSFPSGHTSVSFAAAATLHKRYGWEVGLPAHFVAAFVGVARVKADKHFVHDVVAGAAIGEAAGWLLTSRKNEKVRWLPWGDSHGGGLAMAMHF
jgi:membrane-associated phospholipid phosphatase